METPASGPGAPFETGPASDPNPVREDREVVTFLRSELLPALGRRGSRPLAVALRQAIRDERLDALTALDGRHRHELLTLIEQVIGTRHRAAPAAIVRITTAVSAIATAPDPLGAAAARPAR